MTSHTPYRDQPSRQTAEQARLAVEALFQTKQAPPDKAADVEVVVRRRRFASADGLAEGNDAGEGSTAAVRTPRTFKVERRHEGVEQPEGQGLPSAANPQPNHVDAASSGPGSTEVGRRRRRRLNGAVTIIRPQLHEPHGVRDESFGERAESDLIAARRLHRDEIGAFGTDRAAQLRYQKLLLRIAELERQAHAAKEREAAAAVRWIKKAIRDYGIRAKDLGFEN